MNKTLKLTAALTLMTLVVSSSAFAESRPRRDTNGHRYDSRVVTVEGRIRDLDRDRNGIVIRLDRGGYVLYASRDVEVYARSRHGHSSLRQLERGDHIRATGQAGSRGMRVDTITLVREEDDRRDRDDRTIRGVVQSVDPSRNMVLLREARSGRVIAVDLRNAERNDRGRPNDLVRVHRGDRMTVSGDWRSNGRFEAERYRVN
jgi:small nuclear ribonucleoprotein (snRNP)-like protein